MSGKTSGNAAVPPVVEPSNLYTRSYTVVRGRERIHQRFYQGLRQRGKTDKVALVAVMRKLLLHLNAVARRGTPWLPQAKWPSEPSRA